MKLCRAGRWLAALCALNNKLKLTMSSTVQKPMISIENVENMHMTGVTD
jgi:hypothetical protein